MLTHLAHIPKLSAAQNMETACRFERAQSSKWPRLARDRGSRNLIREELIKLNRERLNQRVSDQLAECAERKKALGQYRGRKPSRAAPPKRGWKKRPPSRNRAGSSC